MIEVPVSPSSVVTEFCEVSTAVFFFIQKACTLLCKYARRDEVRRLTRESSRRQEEE